MLLKISHKTEYHYDEPVPYALQEIRMLPKSSTGQNVISWSTTVEGGRKEVEFTDHHNNLVELISYEPGQHHIKVLCEGQVETTDTAGIVGPHSGYAPLWYFKRVTPLTKPGPHIKNLVKILGRSSQDDMSRLHNLSALILDNVSYEIGRTDSVTMAENAVEAGHGVCQDHAHIFISAARLMGYPARYVSGYLMMNDRVEQDASHAWAEAYVEGLGWVGLDISNGISPDERYVRIATGLDYQEAAPISGIIFGGSDESMIVSLQVQQ